jgi:excisionase family DNA binding protein
VSTRTPRTLSASHPSAMTSLMARADNVAPPAEGPQKFNKDLRPLLTLPEVARLLNLSTRTVRRLRIPCVRIGRSVRYCPSDVERFLAARRFCA